MPDQKPVQQLQLLGKAALALVYPRRCPFCDRVIGFADTCTHCEAAVTALLLPKKRLSPDEHWFGELESAAAVFRYEGVVRDAIHGMKYHGRRWYAADLGNRMAKELYGCTFVRRYGILYPAKHAALALGWDVIVPVPASGKSRGYNIPLLLAQPIALASGLPVQPNALVRRRFVRRQAGLSRMDRFLNVAGAFAAGPHCDVEGKRVLLVDDVITTGVTAAVCAQVLLQQGAHSVDVIALATSERQRKAAAEQIKE